MGLTEMQSFASEVGPSGPVCVVGGETRWGLGGESSAGTRTVRAPSGVESFDPSEMTVAVWAGTRLEELAAALMESRQEVALTGPSGSTVGGSLAVGWNSTRSLRVGAARDALLQAECVGAGGMVFKAGGPTVKNVSGYELCRLLVGSLGTLGLIGRVILRTRPLPERTLWLSGNLSPVEVSRSCYRPASILWDGSSTNVCLEGYGTDVDAEATVLRDHGMLEIAGPPDLPPNRDRWTGVLPEGAILDVPLGVVHLGASVNPPDVDPGVRAIGERMKSNFDPDGRLNPGRDPYLVPA